MNPIERMMARSVEIAINVLTDEQLEAFGNWLTTGGAMSPVGQSFYEPLAHLFIQTSEHGPRTALHEVTREAARATVPLVQLYRVIEDLTHDELVSLNLGAQMGYPLRNKIGGDKIAAWLGTDGHPLFPQMSTMLMNRVNRDIVPTLDSAAVEAMTADPAIKASLDEWESVPLETRRERNARPIGNLHIEVSPQVAAASDALKRIARELDPMYDSRWEGEIGSIVSSDLFGILHSSYPVRYEWYKEIIVTTAGERVVVYTRYMKMGNTFFTPMAPLRYTEVPVERMVSEWIIPRDQL